MTDFPPQGTGGAPAVVPFTTQATVAGSNAQAGWQGILINTPI